MIGYSAKSQERQCALMKDNKIRNKYPHRIIFAISFLCHGYDMIVDISIRQGAIILGIIFCLIFLLAALIYIDMSGYLPKINKRIINLPRGFDALGFIATMHLFYLAIKSF